MRVTECRTSIQFLCQQIGLASLSIYHYLPPVWQADRRWLPLRADCNEWKRGSIQQVDFLFTQRNPFDGGDLLSALCRLSREKTTGRPVCARDLLFSLGNPAAPT